VSNLFDAFQRNYAASAEAFNRHDFEAAFAASPDDLVWEPMPQLVDRERLEGKAAIIEAFRMITDAWPDWNTELIDMTEPAPGLIQLRFIGRGTAKLSGVPTETRFVQEWDFRAQPVTVRERLY
jgi:hypothetical protein